MIGFYNYTVILTYCSLASSVVGIFEAFRGDTLPAIICLLLSGFFDMFDGRVARTKKNRTKEEQMFGIQIDSLTDMCAFCALPVVIAFSHGLKAWHGILAAVLYVLCGMIRLAYFNVTEETRQDHSSEARKEYLGLPVTAIAILLPLVYGIGQKLATEYVQTAMVEFVLYFCAVAYVTPFKIEKPHGKGLIGIILLGLVLVLGYLYLIIF